MGSSLRSDDVDGQEKVEMGFASLLCTGYWEFMEETACHKDDFPSTDDVFSRRPEHGHGTLIVK
ncbi:hypothetical protein JMJ77_0015430 [Colletotrichum scovillei]|uniref:Uncharacterized protein n=1 Tax=Colletotrichum scovillei TaxID=1209932 RepID=A0A9P7R2V8_9PEZI|nr:hypothetical protein JMJ77_0015430 [Colletotrichum scovillei]KAG7057027.1 hypothetical protein JMJ78_0000811 [Colletotrichum scovillei]KAG7066985.1 hypothetical protein JMJ76_0000830 [Colletotrichum scovillei]